MYEARSLQSGRLTDFWKLADPLADALASLVVPKLRGDTGIKPENQWIKAPKHLNGSQATLSARSPALASSCGGLFGQRYATRRVTCHSSFISSHSGLVVVFSLPASALVTPPRPPPAPAPSSRRVRIRIRTRRAYASGWAVAEGPSAVRWGQCRIHAPTSAPPFFLLRGLVQRLIVIVHWLYARRGYWRSAPSIVELRFRFQLAVASARPPLEPRAGMGLWRCASTSLTVLFLPSRRSSLAISSLCLLPLSSFSSPSIPYLSEIYSSDSIRQHSLSGCDQSPASALSDCLSSSSYAPRMGSIQQGH
ncbi:hypothetical protein FB451DRAFT_1411228 [Mycena latifolia]|nr:hypothetical protein FB451DRAFT_1411228 [Mycena latifolia]